MSFTSIQKMPTLDIFKYFGSSVYKKAQSPKVDFLLKILVFISIVLALFLIESIQGNISFSYAIMSLSNVIVLALTYLMTCSSIYEILQQLHCTSYEKFIFYNLNQKIRYLIQDFSAKISNGNAILTLTLGSHSTILWLFDLDLITRYGVQGHYFRCQSHCFVLFFLYCKGKGHIYFFEI